MLPEHKLNEQLLSVVHEYQMQDKILSPKQNFSQNRACHTRKNCRCIVYPSEWGPSNISITSDVVVCPENPTNKQDRHSQPAGLPPASWEFTPRKRSEKLQFDRYTNSGILNWLSRLM